MWVTELKTSLKDRMKKIDDKKDFDDELLMLKLAVTAMKELKKITTRAKIGYYLRRRY